MNPPEDPGFLATLEIAEQRGPEKIEVRFLSPELLAAGADEDISGYDKKPNWDVAVRYQDLKRLLSLPDEKKTKLKERAVQGIIERAKAAMGSVIKPEKKELLSWQEFTAKGAHGELDVTATLDEMVGRGEILESLRFEARVQKDRDVVVLLDASLSMTSDKMALLAVASAVVALCVPSRHLCLVSFSSQPRMVKRFDEELSVKTVVERVLEIPTLGLTNIEGALLEALKILDREGRPGANVILVGDGKYTEGKDPSYLGGRFKKLHALKLGRDIAGRALLQDLVRQGNGRLFEVRRMPELPRVMYGALRSLLR